MKETNMFMNVMSFSLFTVLYFFSNIGLKPPRPVSFFSFFCDQSVINLELIFGKKKLFSFHLYSDLSCI